MSAKLTREALEVLQDCDVNKTPCSECLPHKPPEQACYRFQYERGEIAALALRLAEALKALIGDDGVERDWLAWSAKAAAARSLLAELEG